MRQADLPSRLIGYVQLHVGGRVVAVPVQAIKVDRDGGEWPGGFYTEGAQYGIYVSEEASEEAVAEQNQASLDGGHPAHRQEGPELRSGLGSAHVSVRATARERISNASTTLGRSPRGTRSSSALNARMVSAVMVSATRSPFGVRRTSV